MSGKTPPTVTTGQGILTVTCMTLDQADPLTIVINLGGNQVTTKSDTLPPNQTRSYPFQLPAATYDVSVTQPNPGPTYNYPGRVVS